MKKKTEFSKIIVSGVLIFGAITTLATLLYCFLNHDNAPFTYLIPAIFVEIASATTFYYQKAKAENIIKLKKHYGDLVNGVDLGTSTTTELPSQELPNQTETQN